MRCRAGSWWGGDHRRLLWVHARRGRLADVRGRRRGRRGRAAGCGGRRVPVQAGGLAAAACCAAALLLLLLLVQPFQFLSAGCSPLLLHPSLLLLAAAPRPLHGSRDLRGRLFPALTPSLVLVVSLGAMTRLGGRGGATSCRLKLGGSRLPWTRRCALTE